MPSILAVENCGIVVDGDTWDEVPVPGSGYILVLISLDVCVDNTISEVKPKKLQEMSTMTLRERERPYVLRVGALGILRSCRVHLERSNIARTPCDLGF